MIILQIEKLKYNYNLHGALIINLNEKRIGSTTTSISLSQSRKLLSTSVESPLSTEQPEKSKKKKTTGNKKSSSTSKYKHKQLPCDYKELLSPADDEAKHSVSAGIVTSLSPSIFEDKSKKKKIKEKKTINKAKSNNSKYDTTSIRFYE